MFDWLKKPYPFLMEEQNTRLRIAVFVTVFVFLFLVIFRPFGITTVSELNVFTCCSIYAITSGIVSYLTCSMMIVLFPGFVDEQKWNIGREFLMLNVILLSISIANVIVGLFVEIHPRSDYSIWMTIRDDVMHTYAIGIFPVMVITFTNYTVLLKRNLEKSEAHNKSIYNREAEVIVEMPAIVKLTSATKNNDIEIDLEKLLFIMADGNYVEFHWLENGEEVREIRRNTMNNLTEQLEDYPFIFRTHRAFMVNLNKIAESNGNAQGYQLKLRDTEQLIPVSRSKLADFDWAMSKEEQVVEQYSL
ncbi:MAG: LytTR family transcriptional regulator [Crocinitomicaceae bacterium]|nr:LytTR family transcriptional regulator [Crocinitomicaceae bacterium]